MGPSPGLVRPPDYHQADADADTGADANVDADVTNEDRCFILFRTCTQTASAFIHSHLNTGMNWV